MGVGPLMQTAAYSLLGDVGPGGVHAVCQHADPVRVVGGVLNQQLARQIIGLVHLPLPLMQLLHKVLQDTKSPQGAPVHSCLIDIISTDPFPI